MSAAARNPRRSEAVVEFVGWLVGGARETTESLLAATRGSSEGFVVLFVRKSENELIVATFF